MEIEQALATRLFDLFVVNDSVIAVQEENGYRTKYIDSFDSDLICQLLKHHSSFGCYQQNQNGRIRWLCLDFDIKNKNCTPDESILLLNNLLQNIISNVTEYLESHNLNYLLEFSGRRGIHVWVVFDKTFKKEIGYQLVSEICSKTRIEEKLGEVYGLDKFPATTVISGKKIGKQVKIPLSYHKNGGQSFFINKNYNFNNHPSIVDLYEQLEILKGYKLNNISEICKKYETGTLPSPPIYIKYTENDGKELFIENIINTLRELSVFQLIFKRFEKGNPKTQDFLVLLGTLKPFSNSREIFRDILLHFNVFEEQEFDSNYSKFNLKYHPAKVGYLNRIYDISNTDYENKTTYEYLCDKLGLPYSQAKAESYISDLNKYKNLVEAERNYALYDDEILLPKTIHFLNQAEQVGFSEFQETLRSVDSEIASTPIPKYSIFTRKEEKNREIRSRNMVILPAMDRVITTKFALDIYHEINSFQVGFSYIPTSSISNRIFIDWFILWNSYINKIKQYIQLPFWEDYYVMVFDLKHFYDSIDFLPIYDYLLSKLENGKNKFIYLIKYNEKLMKDITQKRYGVPQGPAYARILSEIFINETLSIFRKTYPQYETLKLLRYVDDFFVMSKDDNLHEFYNDLSCFLSQRRIRINSEKTKIYGIISELSEEEKNNILRKDTIKYTYTIDCNLFNPVQTKNQIYHDLLLDYDSVENIPFIFSKITDRYFQSKYFMENNKLIFSSKFGRGSIFNKAYKYFFDNFAELYDISHEAIPHIPQDSINQYSFITSLFWAIKAGKITKEEYTEKLSDIIRSQQTVNREISAVKDAIIFWGEK